MNYYKLTFIRKFGFYILRYFCFIILDDYAALDFLHKKALFILLILCAKVDVFS